MLRHVNRGGSYKKRSAYTLVIELLRMPSIDCIVVNENSWDGALCFVVCWKQKWYSWWLIIDNVTIWSPNKGAHGRQQCKVCTKGRSPRLLLTIIFQNISPRPLFLQIRILGGAMFRLAVFIHVPMYLWQTSLPNRGNRQKNRQTCTLCTICTKSEASVAL